MTLNEKQIVMDKLKEAVPIFKRRTPIRWSIRCPYCGDSGKSPTDSHCYIKCSNDEAEPLLWNCFLCNKHGVIDEDFLKAAGVKADLSEIVARQRSNRIKSLKDNPVDIITGEPIPDSPQIKYIEHRIGKGLTLEDYDRFKVVWNIQSLLPYISSESVKNSLPSNRESISFLSDDKSVLLTRLFEDGDIRWKKLRLMGSYDGSFYTIKSTMDLFTKDPIVVNIAEGVIDILSIYKNFNDGPNSIFIASLGSNYESALMYAINKGFVGTNVTIKIYIDNDQNEKYLARSLKTYKWMFGGIYIYRNVLSKDVGTTIDKIKLEERKV